MLELYISELEDNLTIKFPKSDPPFVTLSDWNGIKNTSQAAGGSDESHRRRKLDRVRPRGSGARTRAAGLNVHRNDRTWRRDQRLVPECFALALHRGMRWQVMHSHQQVGKVCTGGATGAATLPWRVLVVLQGNLGHEHKIKFWLSDSQSFPVSCPN